ncbi:OLC1v1012257C1 [Oldenlandia corymbosa var. corymbosa]|uniref:OLC1v1012257C1 n=1 Tax=Oldenlandia corymbosa var. corymbosa TaxID=529605 RepID=A0AAV1DYQ5_OLDCO|nr:OLC1v1012257C1 [Oldenlandia corymbosa var. corymbosa]
MESIFITLLPESEYKFPITIYKVPYLVEASNGELLLVQRVFYSGEFMILRSAGFDDFGRFNVFKLAKKKIQYPDFDMEELDWVKVSELENNETIFLSNNRRNVSTSAFCVPDFDDKNCIYLTHNFQEQHTSSRHEDVGVFRIFGVDKDIGVFHKNDGIAAKHQCFGDDKDDPLLLIWITPTLCLS